jgi:uncharacterized protein YabN with tetrapyrrole methylase and pyrophosphatase domain
VGFDWPDTEGPVAKIEEELSEVREHLNAAAPRDAHAPPVIDDAHAELESELGDLLFSCVNLCRKAGVHAALALDKANAKFETRFRAVEEEVKRRGKAMGSLELEELDAIWDSVKSTEQKS